MFDAKENTLAHGWEILAVQVVPTRYAAEVGAERLRGPRGCGWEVRIGEANVKKFGAEITVWVVVKRRKRAKAKVIECGGFSPSTYCRVVGCITCDDQFNRKAREDERRAKGS